MLVPWEKFAIGSLLWSFAVGLASASICDANLRPPLENPWAYKLRGDRCEGVYVRNVVGAELAMVSFTSGFEDFLPESRPALRIRWGIPSTGNVLIRAHSLRRRLYYQMDTERGRGALEYSWPTDVIAALQLSREDLGVVARAQVTEKTGSAAEAILPVSVGSAMGKPLRNYDLIILAGSELAELYLSMAPAAPRDLHTPQAEPRTIEGYYPANTPIHVDVPWPEASGLYMLRLGALFRDGRSSTLRFNFFHVAQ